MAKNSNTVTKNSDSVLKTETVLVTGAAGFIGSSLVDALLKRGWNVTGVDNLDDFYSRELKLQNIAKALQDPKFRFVELDLRNRSEIEKNVSCEFDTIIHLAAKAGVRPSISNPLEYTEVNVLGTQNILELARARSIKKVLFASSSSVYGNNGNLPWSEEDQTLFPISPYAFTKLAGESMGRVYSRLFGIRFIALRFFTVYGPRQRPDLAIHKFAKMLLDEKEITLFGDGSTSRDYTYIDDIVQGICSALEYNSSDFEIFNLGNSARTSLLELVVLLEETIGVEARLKYLPMQSGDVDRTWADITKARQLLKYNPGTSVQSGIEKFVSWLKQNG